MVLPGCEAISMTGRWYSQSFELLQRLLAFKTTQKHCDHPQLASLITHVLGQLGIQPQCVVNTSRDSASTNGAACRLLLANPYINATNTLCIAHTISNAGDHIVLPILAEFTTPWLELVGGRPVVIRMRVHRGTLEVHGRTSGCSWL